MEVPFNFVALLVSALAYFFLGWAWYSSPFLFQQAWMKEMGIKKLSKKEMDKAMKGMWKPMVGNFLALFVTAWVFSHVIAFAGAFLQKSGTVHGMITGFYIWLGFFATALLNTVFWEKRSWKLYFINIGYHLCGLLLMGGILASFK